MEQSQETKLDAVAMQRRRGLKECSMPLLGNTSEGRMARYLSVEAKEICLSGLVKEAWPVCSTLKEAWLLLVL